MALRNRWLLLITLALVQVFMFGPSVATIGVFFTPLMKQFGWNHAQVAQIATAVNVSLGICSVLSGWLLDRLDARWVMSVGAGIAGVGFLLASRSGSLPLMVACYAIVGVGVALAAMVPTAVVAANWFPDRIALAIGIGHFGTALGLSLSPRIIAGVVVHGGWRLGMLMVSLPMLLVAAPVSLLFLRSRPPEMPVATERNDTQRAVAVTSAAEIPGLEVSAALCSSAFWLLFAVNFFSQVGLGAVYYHTIPYLLAFGYPIGIATVIFGLKGFFTGPGAILWGAVSDRVGPKFVVVVGYSLFAFSVVLLLVAGTRRFGIAPLFVYMVLWGTDTGAGVAIPVLLARTQGKRRFGTLNGILGLAAAIGQGVGPLAAGVIIDVTRRYSIAFEAAALCIFVSAMLGPLIVPAKGHDQVPAKLVSAAA